MNPLSQMAAGLTGDVAYASGDEPFPRQIRAEGARSDPRSA